MRRTLVGFALCLLSTSLVDCSTDSCQVDHLGPECLAKSEIPPGGLGVTTTAVQPRRLSHQTSAQLTLQVPGYGSATATMSQGAVSTSLGSLDASGHLEFTLSAFALSHYTLGPAQLIVSKPGLTDQNYTIRIYSTPLFDPDAAMQHWASVNVQADSGFGAHNEPVMVGVLSSRNLQVLNQFTTGTASTQNQSFLQYSMKATPSPMISRFTQPLPIGNPVFSRNVPIGFALSDSQVLFAGSESTDPTWPTRLVRCSISDSICSFGSLNVSQTLAMLCGERSGRLVAAMVNDSLRAFGDYQLSAPVAIDSHNPSAGFPVAAIGVGDLDGDRNPDLAVFYTTSGAEAVYLGGAAGLTWSEGYSRGLQQATIALLGGGAPSAVRLGDLDGDGLDDLILSSGPKLVVAANQSDGSFAQIATFGSLGQGTNALGDITSIGVGALHPAPSNKASIALTARATGRLAVLLNQATE